MAQRIEFDLADSVILSGTLKTRLNVDMTNFPALTGSSFSSIIGIGPDFGKFFITATDGAFTSELVVGAIVIWAIGGAAFYATVTVITSDDEIEVTEFDGAGEGTIDTGTLKSLVVPTDGLIISMDDHTEKVDVRIGLYEYDDFNMTFADDYSYYGAGFWYHLFRYSGSSPVMFFIRMEEGGVDSFVTYGGVNLATVDFSELAVANISSPASGAKVRTLSVSILSGLNLLKFIPTSNIITAALAREVSSSVDFTYTILPPSPPYFTNINVNLKCVKLSQVVAEIIAAAFSQTYDAATVQVRNEDITFKDYAGADMSWADLYMLTRSAYAPSNYYGYMDANSERDYWVNRYPTAFELLQALTMPFGLVPRYFYGDTDGTYNNGTPANNKHRIEMLTRGNCETAVTMTGSVKSSSVKNYSPHIVNNVRASVRSYEFHNNNGTSPVTQTRQDAKMFYNTVINPDASQTAELYTDDAQKYPVNVNYDIDIFSDWITRYNGNYQYPDVPSDSHVVMMLFSYNAGANRMVPVTAGQWYNYSTHAFVSWTSDNYGTDCQFLVALSSYLYNRFKGQAQYSRQYSSVKASDGSTNSQRNLRALRRHEIVDEYGTRTFYAIEVRKSYVANTAQVVWFEQ